MTSRERGKRVDPNWMGNIQNLITTQTSSISNLTDQISAYMAQNQTSKPPPAKRSKPTVVPSQPQKTRPPCKPDSDDDFDKRFGHLFEP